MIYLVTTQLELFDNNAYKTISAKESLEIMKDWKVVQYDSETTGRDSHINKILCVQFGNDAADTRIVVDTTTIDLMLYKDILENKTLIGQNLKFDLAFLYNYNIIPRKIYDTMIVEQLLHLGYPSGSISYSLKAIAERRLGVDIDKTVRGEIIWRGLDLNVILYSAGDVTYLEKIAESQLKDLHKQELMVGAKLECDFVPVIAYLEWCGIKLSESKWKTKMDKDLERLKSSEEALKEFVVNTPSLKQFTHINYQGSLFDGYDLTPKVDINWSSSSQVVKVAKILGFNTTVTDKKTGESKDSVLEKHLAMQKGINDKFIELYLDYQGNAKVVSSFGQGHLDAINPNTGRLYTSYKQLGAASGRMSCGSQQPNTDLAKLKHLPASACKYVNIQQLPHDAETRACFVAEDKNKLIDCDWSAAEARLAGDIYDDQAIKDIFLNNIDSHSMYAKIFFKEELKDIDVHDVKKLRPDLRQRSKGPEFKYKSYF